MAIITDVEKLRPELLTKSPAELQRMATEIQMAIDHQAQEARRKEVASIVKEANAHIENIVAGLRYLESHSLLSDEMKTAHSSTAGVFTPHLRYKQVDADRVLARMGDAPKKTRRKKAT